MNPSFQIFVSIFLPFLIPSIKFTVKKTPTELIEESDDSPQYDTMKIHDPTVHKDTPDHRPHSPKVAPEPGDDNETEEMSKTKILKHKLYKVTCMGGCSRDDQGLSILSAILFFYTAPVTKFWANLVRLLLIVILLYCLRSIEILRITLLFVHL